MINFEHEDGIRVCRPGRGKPHWPVEFLALRAGTFIDIVAIADCNWYAVHWFDGKHRLCRVGDKECTYCEKGLPFTSHGYFPCVRKGIEGRNILIAHITERMWAECPSVGEKPLRGYAFTYRAAAKRRGKPKIEPAGLMCEIEKQRLPVCNGVLDFLKKSMGD